MTLNNTFIWVEFLKLYQLISWNKYGNFEFEFGFDGNMHPIMIYQI